MQAAEQEMRDRIKELIRGKKFDELEELWLEIVDGDVRSDSFHQSVARYLFNKKELGRLADLYGTLLAQRNKEGKNRRVLEIATVLLDFDPLLEFLRPHLVEAVKALYADRGESTVADFLRVSGLGGDAPNLKQALARLEDLAGASKGQVFHHNVWGLGVVRELDARENWAIVDFAKKPNHRMTIEGIKNYLKRIPSDHVQARIASDPEGFRAEMFDDPAGAIRLALKSFGGKIKAADMKKLFMESFLTEAEYKRWWNKAKDATRLDPYIDTQGMGLNTVFILRKEPRSFVDEVLASFLEAKSLADRRQVLRDVARHGDNADMTPQDVAKLHELFRKPLDEGMLNTPEELFGHGILFEEYSALFPDDAKNPIDVEQYLTNPEYHPGRMIISLKIMELQRIALEHVLKLRNEEAEAIFAEVFFAADTRLATWMERALANEGKQEVLEHCLERILGDPTRNPDLFAWAGRQVIDGQLPHVAESIHPLQICELAASVLSISEERLRDATGEELKEARTAATRMRTILQDNQHKYLKKAVRQATPEQTRRFLAHISLLSGLPNPLRRSMEDLVHYEQPDLKGAKADAEDERGIPQFHYAFAESVEQKRRELSHIVNVEIPENSKAIGIAREHGDLRENSEYHAAKDRQKLLMQRAHELEELISRARIVSAEQIRTDCVRIGTRAIVRRKENGGEESYTLVGMWEADGQTRISYLTPFGSQLLNRRPEEHFEVTLPDGGRVEYEVVRIERGF